MSTSTISFLSPKGTWLGGLPEELELISVGHEFVKQGQKVIAVRE